MNCDVGELFLQPFRYFTYVTTHYPTLPLLYLRHRTFSNPSVASPTSQFILQAFFRFSYVTGSSLTSPGEPPMMNMLWILTDGHVLRGGCGLYLLSLVLQLTRNPREYLNQGNHPIKIEPGPALLETTMLPPDHSAGQSL